MGILKSWFIAAVILLIYIQKVTPQEGNPYITNFPVDFLADRQISAIQEGEGNVMFFGNRRGILYFDSEEWNLVSVPFIPMSLAFDSLSGKLLIGGMNDIGYLEKDYKGSLYYTTLVNKADVFGNFSRISIAGRYAWYYSDENLVQVSLETFSITRQWIAPLKSPYTGFVTTGEKVFLNTRDKGLAEVSDTSMIPAGIRNIANEKVICSFPFNQKQVMLGTENGLLFLFDGKKLARYSISDSIYLKESMLQGGIDLNNNIVFSTLLGGCLVVEKKNGKTANIINFNSGLPDDEIYALGKDKNLGLWLSHQYGLSRVALKFPVRNFSNYPGLKGTLNSMIDYNNQVYVSTNEGIFYLNRIEEFVSKEVIEKKTVPKSLKAGVGPGKKDEGKSRDQSKGATVTGQEQKPEKELSKRELRKLKKEQEKAQQEATGKKPGFLAKIFGSFQSEEKKQQKEVAPEILIRKKKIYSLQAVHYQYEKIEGIAGKCREMLALEDRILVATNAGLYEIINRKVKPVLKDKYIIFMQRSKYKKTIYAGTPDGFQSFSLSNGNWKAQSYGDINKVYSSNNRIYSVDERSKDELWLGSENFIYRLITDASGNTKEFKPYYVHTEFAEPFYIRFINDQLYVFLSRGIYRFSGDSLQLYKASSGGLQSAPRYYYDEGPIVWAHLNNQWIWLADTSIYKGRQIPYLSLFDDVQDLHYDKSGNLWVVDMNNHLARILPPERITETVNFELFTKSVQNDQNISFSIERFEVDYANASLRFYLMAPFYLKAEAVEYQYRIQNLKKSWSEWTSESRIDLPIIPPGKYILHVRARNMLGTISNEQTIRFVVRPPFWQKPWFIAVCVVILAGLVYLFVKWRIRQLEEDKRILEVKVKERTIEIQKQKEQIEVQRDELAIKNKEVIQQKDEIEAQRDEIEVQKNALEDQNKRIAFQNKEITDSIIYAKRIQTAVMPSEAEIMQIIPESFILFKPRDIVSGDFYWMTQKREKTIVVAADCTGHGVPGAFMSMLGISFLDEIVNVQELPRANEILNELRQNVLNTLSQKVENVEMQDGMDIALVIIDRKEMQVEFAGAYNPLILIRNGELHEVSADRMPIGTRLFERESFKSHFMKIYHDDVLYIFSDGYISQFGGQDDRKFNSKAFRQLLMNVHTKPMKEQKQILETTMTEYMGNHEQMDDMMVIGIRL